MKKMRKIMSMLLAVCLLLSVCISAFAAGTPTLEDYAYMDFDTADPELQLVILAARRHLIYGPQAWSADGNSVIIRADGSVEEVPTFAEVFPGWDLTLICTLDVEEANAALIAYGLEEYLLENSTGAIISGAQSRAPGFNGNVLLTAAKTGQYAPTFYRFNASGETIRTYAATLPDGCQSYNVGYNNEDTGVQIDWFPYMKIGDEIATLQTEDGVRYGVRVSTYSNVGYARMIVEVV